MISLSRRKLKWQLKPYGSLPPSPFIGYQELFFRHLSCHLLHLWEQNENKGAQIGWPAKNNCRKNGPKTHPGGKPQNHPHLPLEVSTTGWHLPTGGSVVMQPTQEMWVWSLGWEDFLKQEMATHSSILAWIIPRAEEAAVHGVAKSQTWRNWANTHTHTHTHTPLRGLNHVLLQLLTFNTPWTELRVESGNEALCAQGAKTGRTGLQILGYFQE